MKELVIHIQPTLFTYQGYIIDGHEQKSVSVPLNMTNIATFADAQEITTITLCGNANYIKGVQKQLSEKTTIPINLLEV